MDNLDFITNLLTKDDLVLEIRNNLNDLTRIIPELKCMIGFNHRHPHHHLDVFEHTLLALNFSKNDLKIRVSLLFHDVGKPLSYQTDGEVNHYRGHAKKSCEIAKSVLERLKFSSDFIDQVCEIILRHDTPLTKDDLINSPTLFRDVFEVQKCDVFAHNPKFNQKRLAYIDSINLLLSE